MSAWRRAASAMLCAAAFAASLAAVAASIHRALPFPQVSQVEEKLAHWREHAGGYDTLFMGSSRIYHQILPEQFDRRMAELGMPLRSFNAGIDGMRPPEVNYFFDQLAAAPGTKLRWVFIELAGLRSALDDDKRGTLRAIYWHDWPRMKLLCQRAAGVMSRRASREVWLEEAGGIAEHATLFFQSQFNVGRGSLLTGRFTQDEPRPLEQKILGPRGDGWAGADRGEAMPGEWLAEYQREFRERMEKPARVDFGDPVSQEALAQMIARIEALGAKPVLIVPPTTNKRNFMPDPNRHGWRLVLDFSDVLRWGELYEEQHRLDTAHVNTAGARLFTDALAAEFAAAMKTK